MSMKKPLTLILPMLFASSLVAASKIELLDYDSDTRVSGYCIAGYAFTSITTKKDRMESSLTQIMRKHGNGGAMPMSCKEYKESKPKKL